MQARTLIFFLMMTNEVNSLKNLHVDYIPWTWVVNFVCHSCDLRRLDPVDLLNWTEWITPWCSRTYWIITSCSYNAIRCGCTITGVPIFFSRWLQCYKRIFRIMMKAIGMEINCQWQSVMPVLFIQLLLTFWWTSEPMPQTETMPTYTPLLSKVYW